MYCSKCGKEIPNDSKFCGSCGAAVQRKKQRASGSKSEEKKHKVPAGISLAVLVTVFLLGKFVVAPSMLSEPEQSRDFYQQEATKETVTNELPASGSYSEIFSSRNIVEMPALFMMLDSASFAAVDQDGMIEKLEFGYRDDRIEEMVNTLYFPIVEMDDAEKNALDAAIKENLAGYAAVDFCSVSYNMGNLYYTATVHFSQLDVAENIQKMSGFGMLTADNADYLSMSQTESNLIASGYIKK